MSPGEVQWRPEVERRLGALLGFPSCCVESFLAGRWACHVPKPAQLVMRGQRPDGFVPCAEHCLQIVRGVATVGSVLGRTHSIKGWRFRFIARLACTLEAVPHPRLPA